MTRLLSLDVFRGITIALMILVNSPGNQVSYAWLQHSTWNGCTLADVVFPFFIVIVGMSSVLALTNLKIKGVSNQQLFKAIIKRSVYLFVMGLVLNVLPTHFDFYQIRLMGVLQRIAICYFFGSILFLTTTIRQQVIVLVMILLGYWFLITGFPHRYTLSMNHNLVGYIDQLLLSPRHLYTPLFDPEGLLSTLPAIGSVLLGNFIGYCVISLHTKRYQLQWMMFCGLFFLFLGWFWSSVFPWNKSLWSSSYVLWTGGLAYWVYAICFMLIEMRQWTDWSKSFSLFGRSAMLVYFLHVVFLKIQTMILVQNTNGEMMHLRHYITTLLFGNFKPQTASLCYAILYTLLWLSVIKCLSEWRLYRLRYDATPLEHHVK